MVERTYYAWAYLRGLRRLGDDDLCRKLGIVVPIVPTAPTDLDLADAEHYMYARFLAGSTGDPTTSTLVGGYEAIKILRLSMGDFPCCLRLLTLLAGDLAAPMTDLQITRVCMAAKPGRLAAPWRRTNNSRAGNTRMHSL